MRQFGQIADDKSEHQHGQMLKATQDAFDRSDGRMTFSRLFSDLKKSQGPKTTVTVAADNNVVMDGDAERFGSVNNLFGHFYVGARGSWIARGVVVD